VDTFFGFIKDYLFEDELRCYESDLEH